MAGENVEIYAKRNTLEIEKQIGFGIHGRVFTVFSRRSGYRMAIKEFEDEAPYERERDVYFRLAETETDMIGKFHVPQMVDHDDELLLLHMTVVKRPFCLDFASAYLDELPAYFPPMGQEWQDEKEDQFGSEHWPEVLACVRELESLGIYQTDVSPSNIAL